MFVSAENGSCFVWVVFNSLSNELCLHTQYDLVLSEKRYRFSIFFIPNVFSCPKIPPVIFFYRKSLYSKTSIFHLLGGLAHLVICVLLSMPTGQFHVIPLTQTKGDPAHQLRSRYWEVTGQMFASSAIGLCKIGVCMGFCVAWYGQSMSAVDKMWKSCLCL